VSKLFLGSCLGGTVITTREEIAVQRGEGAHRFALAAAELAANTRCENVVVLDLRGRSPVTEYFVIATGTSPRQMRTVVDEIVDLGKQTGFTAWQQSGYESARWIVLDCVNVVVHVFDSESRDFYDLELLWGDSPRVDWRKELGLPAAYEAPAAREEEEEELEDVLETEEAENADAGDADMDEEAETDLPVVTEVPDESTGSNSVEFVEIDPPSKQGQKGRDVFPTRVEEEEDTTEEERGMGLLSEVAEAVERLEEDEEAVEIAAAKRRRSGKRQGGKGAGKAKTVKKPAKKAVKKAAKKVAKKGAKEAIKRETKKAVKKAGKKHPAKTKK
jgi:ribosome-associated protein